MAFLGDTTMVDALPEMIKVGAFDFAIEKVDTLEAHSRGVYGQCSSQLMTLSIQRQMPSRQKAVDTFLHELLHAIWWERDLEDADKEERTVGCLSTGLVQVHRDNPWLADWIKKGT
jgi:hypothetical protein